MTDHISKSDLCINCLNAETCTYCLHHSKPIIFCAEFSCAAPGILPAEEEAASFVVSVRNRTVKGLCDTCDNKDICTLNRGDDLIINCEEYR